MSVSLKHAGGTAIESKYTVMSWLLGLPIASEADEYRLSRAGLNAKAVRHLVESIAIKADLIAPETTVRRRYRDDSPFTTDESERALRLARVFAEARLLFGDEDATQAWFHKPVVLAEGQSPMAPMTLAATETGARLVESRLRRTAYGHL